MLPPEGQRQVEDAAYDLVSKASSLAGQMNPIVTSAISSLVRSMNCYYSSLIEGHNTHPRDIDRAFTTTIRPSPSAALQLEAVAHIEVQQAIDKGGTIPPPPYRRDMLCGCTENFAAGYRRICCGARILNQTSGFEFNQESCAPAK